MKNNKPYIEIPLPSTNEEWKENRMLGIGGSDAASALNMSPYKSQYTLWCEKTKRIDNDFDNESMRIGRDLEDYVAQRFCEATGKKVRKVNHSFQSKEYPFMLANIDREVIGEDAGLECKTASALTRTRYDRGNIPIQYYLQCMHYMAVTGKKKWYIAILVMGVGFYWFEVNRDEDDIEILTRGEKSFWEFVQSDIMPPIDGSESTEETLKQIYPEAQESLTCELDHVDYIIERHKVIKEMIDKLTTEKREIENILKNELDDHTLGFTNKHKVEWKNTRTTRLDMEMLKREYPEVYSDCLKETKSRRFKIKELEEE